MTKVESTLHQANSLHPKIHVRLDPSPPPSPDCHLDVLFELPASLFVDPYQLQDHQTTLGTATVLGEHDLELPLEKVKEKRGSLVFLRDPLLEFYLPLHLRYQAPSDTNDDRPIVFRKPDAGWTCGSGLPRVDHPLGPESDLEWFRFGQEGELRLRMPLGRLQDGGLVSLGTLSTVIICTIWMLYSVHLTLQKRKRSQAKGKRRKSE